MHSESKKGPQQSIVYITRDLERALPLLGKKNHFIVTNSTPFAHKLAEKHKGLFLINEQRILDTKNLLSHEKTRYFLKTLNNVNIVVFKNTAAIERICSENGWILLNPSAKSSSYAEEKISQIEWLGAAKKFLPPHEIIKGSELKFENNKFIIQFNRAHTGSGTILIDSTGVATKISEKFPDRPLRKSAFIKGPVFTVNNIIAEKKVLIGSPSYQITGLKPFTDNEFATVGNDWSLPRKILSKKNLHTINEISKMVGARLIKDGWTGLFGIDVILEENSKKIYLLEINARQPASTSFETILQKIRPGSTFFLHLAALRKLKINSRLVKVTNGAQIILRNQENSKKFNIKKIEEMLMKRGFSTISYLNLDPGSDLLRIMSKKGIMANHNELNKSGLLIKNIIEKYG